MACEQNIVISVKYPIDRNMHFTSTEAQTQLLFGAKDNLPQLHNQPGPVSLLNISPNWTACFAFPPLCAPTRSNRPTPAQPLGSWGSGAIVALNNGSAWCSLQDPRLPY